MAMLPDHSKKLSKEELQELLEKCAHGDMDARERIILSYLPLVRKVCFMFINSGVPFDDLYQEGCYGLILSLNKYDYNSDKKFSSCALTYILKYIRKAVITQASHPIIYPEDVFYELQKYLRTFDNLSGQLRRSPTDKELAEALHKTEERVKLLGRLFYTYFPMENLSRYYELVNSSASSAEVETFKQMRIFDISELGVTLTEREEEVICRRCGFTATGVPESTKEVAEALGLHIETIRLAYNSGIEKLRKAIEENGKSLDYIVY